MSRPWMWGFTLTAEEADELRRIVAENRYPPKYPPKAVPRMTPEEAARFRQQHEIKETT